MSVTKRDGRKQKISFRKIEKRISNVCMRLNRNYVDASLVSQKVIVGLIPEIQTSQIDALAAETAGNLVLEHPDYSLLAARIALGSLYKITSDSFAKTAERLYNHTDQKSNRKAPLLSENVYEFIQKHGKALDAAIRYDFDSPPASNMDYFGFRTYENANYLLRCENQIAERPQHLLMRVACGLHCGDVDAALETYRALAAGLFTHATPTLFSAGTPTPQLSSCFLLTTKDDSIEGIYDTLKDCALISKNAGGIGLAVHNVRACGSYIKGTNGTSNGLVPMLRVFNDTARYVDQGGGKRKGAFAIYLEPWHADIFDVLLLRKNQGKEELRARDLFYGLWIPDLFMERVEKDEKWTLFCPNSAPGLADVWGEEFVKLYISYEEAKCGKEIKARDLWQAILESQEENGTPYMLYKDACNRTSNQQHLGTIRSSNLCTEIIQYTSPEEIAVCNLASVALPKCVDIKTRTFDHKQLFDIVVLVTRNLNKIIDINHYPVPEAKVSNHRHRPIGIGVQGLADTFILLRYPFESKEARQLNREIFETMYFAALTASMELAKRDGWYETYPGSPMSQGKLHFDHYSKCELSSRWDWKSLRNDIKTYGVRNSLLLAPMPTATTSQILGNNECFEPFTSNLYSRRTLAGEFICITKYLVHDLDELGLWDSMMKNRLKAEKGSVQNIKSIPQELKDLYKTVWEIKQQTIIDYAADRGVFVDQSQSLNIHMKDVSFAKLSSLHFYTWKQGLKTGMYYLRTMSAADAIPFTVDQNLLRQSKAKEIIEGDGVCDKSQCVSCSS